MRNQSQKATSSTHSLDARQSPRVLTWLFGLAFWLQLGFGFSCRVFEMSKPSSGANCFGQDNKLKSPGPSGGTFCHTSPTIWLGLWAPATVYVAAAATVAAATKSVVTPAKALHMARIVGGFKRSRSWGIWRSRRSGRSSDGTKITCCSCWNVWFCAPSIPIVVDVYL